MKSTKKRYDTAVNRLTAVILLCIALIVCISAAAPVATAERADTQVRPYEAVLQIADPIRARAEAAVKKALEAASGVTPPSTMMETLADGVSKVGRRLTGIQRRARYIAFRIANPVPKKPMSDRLGGGRNNG